MKLVIAIVQDKDAGKLRSVFIANDIMSTKFATAGSFLRAGNSTFFVAIDEERVPKVLDLIKETCSARQSYMTPPVTLSNDPVDQPFPIEVQVGGATVMVVPLDSFHQF